MADFEAVEARLRQILEPYRRELSVTTEGPGGMVLELPGFEGKPWGYVAGTKIGKSYVSFHLMSVYTDPELMASMSPALRKRMQGKSCFNFTKVDEPLMAELDVVAARGSPATRPWSRPPSPRTRSAADGTPTVSADAGGRRRTPVVLAGHSVTAYESRYW